MIKKVFRPFWSYDVEKTEEWLSSMAENGYHLVKINVLTRRFTFEKAEPKELTYSIVFDKKFTGTIATTLSNDGWSINCQHRNWHILKNEQPEITTFPNREGIMNHNRVLMYIFGGILVYLSFSLLLSITLISSSLLSKAPVEVVPSPFWVLTPFIGLTIIGSWTLALYSTIKLHKTNQRLIGELPTYISQSEEAGLKRSGEMIVKRKRLWFDAPDKLEEWLERMELQGYNLHRISKTGFTFYFEKGSHRKVSYCVDYQKSAKKTYFDMHQEAGWKAMFTSTSSVLKWTIWSREYMEDGEQPQIYTDQSSQIKHARRVGINNILLALPMLFLIYLMLTMNEYFSFDMSLYRWGILMIYIFGIGFALIRMVRTTLYYLRMRNIQ